VDLLAAVKKDPLADSWPYPFVMLVGVLSLGTALVGLLMGEFRLNSFGSSSFIRRRQEPLSFWGMFLFLAALGVFCIAVSVPPIFFAKP
jgi:hypothetical protein